MDDCSAWDVRLGSSAPDDVCWGNVTAAQQRQPAALASIYQSRWAILILLIGAWLVISVRWRELRDKVEAAVEAHGKLQARGRQLLREKAEAGQAGGLLAVAARRVDPLRALVGEFRRTRHRGALAGATLLVLCFIYFKFVAFPQAQFALIDVVVDRAKEEGLMDTDSLWDLYTNHVMPLCWILFAIQIGRLVALVASDVLFEVATQEVRVDLRTRLFNAILDQEAFFFDSVKSGELTARLTGDADRIERVISDAALRLSKALLRTAAAITCMLYFHRAVCLLLMLFAPIEVYLMAKVGSMNRSVTEVRAHALAASDAAAVESISNARTVKCLAGQDLERSLYRRHLDEYLGVLRSSLAPKLFIIYTHRAVLYSEAVLLWALGMYLVLSGAMTIGEWLLLKDQYSNYKDGIRNFTELWTTLSEAMGHSKRYYAVVERVPLLHDRGGEKPSACVGTLRFRDVKFAYPEHGNAAGTGTNVLHGVSFDVRSGQVVALVGPSGSGKSTCVGLVSRLWDATGGSVELDGRDVRTLDATWIRQRIAVVEQSPSLFDRSIADNIAYAMEQRPSDDEIKAAAQAACAHDFIMRLPHGYDTLIGERGVRLSGGERQRIGLARALVRNPRVLVLDEATASLDASSEREVQLALNRLMAGRSTLVVAHRLSTVRAADNILVMSRGHIVESGTHEELMAIDGGTYATFVQHQTLQ